MEFVTAGSWGAFRATFTLIAVWFISARFGGFLLSWIPNGIGLDREEKSLFSAALGISVVSLAILIIGLTGHLVAVNLWGMLGVLFALPFLRRQNVFLFSMPVFPNSVWQKVVFAVVIFIAALAWTQATPPPIATDALSYHLFHPKQFVLRHQVCYVPFSRESLWPYQTEMLYALSLLIEGTMMTQLFQWSFYLLTGWGIFLLAKRMAGESVAWLSALIFLLTPAAFAQSGAPYVDLSLAFFTLLAFYPLVVYGSSQSAPLVFLSGLMAGAACGTKYLGLGAALVLFVLWVFETRGSRKFASYFLLGCALTAGVWYVRSWAVIGNPVYPFFSKYFGGHGYEFDIAANVGRETGLLGFIKLLWNMTFYPGSFGGQTLGPFFLMLLPALIFFVKKASKAAVGAALFSFLYTYFLYRQSQHLRFYISVAPFLSVGAGYAALRLFQSKDLWARVSLALFAALVVLHLGIFVYRIRDAVPVLTGRVSAKEYLLNHQRSFKAFDLIGDRMTAGDRLFNGAETCYFYSPDPDSPIDGIPFRRWLSDKHMSLDDYLAKEGFRFVLTGDGSPPELMQYLRQAGYQKVLDYDFYEKPALFHFQVYEQNR